MSMELDADTATIAIISTPNSGGGERVVEDQGPPSDEARLSDDECLAEGTMMTAASTRSL